MRDSDVEPPRREAPSPPETGVLGESASGTLLSPRSGETLCGLRGDPFLLNTRLVRFSRRLQLDAVCELCGSVNPPWKPWRGKPGRGAHPKCFDRLACSIDTIPLSR